MSVIFTTIHGSRLYGFDHPDSDHDTYTVVTDDHDFEGAPTRQQVRGYGDQRTDDITFTLSEFLKRVEKGSHQALEALFSTEKVWGPEGVKYAAFFERMQITSPKVFDAYERTIRKFAFGDFKRRRHAIRLDDNLRELRKWGYFNPRVNEWRFGVIDALAREVSGKALLALLDIPESSTYDGANETLEEKND